MTRRPVNGSPGPVSQIRLVTHEVPTLRIRRIGFVDQIKARQEAPGQPSPRQRPRYRTGNPEVPHRADRVGCGGGVPWDTMSLRPVRRSLPWLLRRGGRHFGGACCRGKRAGARGREWRGTLGGPGRGRPPGAPRALRGAGPTVISLRTVATQLPVDPELVTHVVKLGRELARLGDVPTELASIRAAQRAGSCWTGAGGRAGGCDDSGDRERLCIHLTDVRRSARCGEAA